MIEYTEDAFTHAPWSYSKGRMALECPYKFKHKYIDKSPVPPTAISGDLVIGSALHKALEYIVNGVHPEIAIDLAVESMAEEKGSRSLTVSEQEDYYSYRDKINEFSKRISVFMRKHGVTNDKKYVERRVGMTKDFRPARFFGDSDLFFRGVWDLGMRSKTDWLVVLDHKRRGFAKLDKYETQLKQYAVTAEANFKDIKGVRAGIHFIETGQIMWAEPYSVEKIREELRPEFISWANSAAEAAKQITIAVGYYCRWCPFKDAICKPERTKRRKIARETGGPLDLIQR